VFDLIMSWKYWFFSKYLQRVDILFIFVVMQFLNRSFAIRNLFLLIFIMPLHLILLFDFSENITLLISDLLILKKTGKLLLIQIVNLFDFSFIFFLFEIFLICISIFLLTSLLLIVFEICMLVSLKSILQSGG
jgi:hypothetical protein